MFVSNWVQFVRDHVVAETQRLEGDRATASGGIKNDDVASFGSHRVRIGSILAI